MASLSHWSRILRPIPAHFEWAKERWLAGMLLWQAPKMKHVETKIMKKMSNMRCLLLTGLLLGCWGIASAQIQKGSWFVEGSFGGLGISNNKGQLSINDTLSSNSKSRSFNCYLYPRAAYMLTDNLAVGAEIEFYIYGSNYEYQNADKIKTSTSKSSNITLGLAPFARYYFARSSNGKSAFYGQVTGGLSSDVRYRYSSQSFDTTGAETSTYVYNYDKPYKIVYGSAMLGWNRMLSENVALNLSLGYRRQGTSQSYSYIYGYPNTTSTTSDLYQSKSASGNLTWSGGITAFIPTK